MMFVTIKYTLKKTTVCGDANLAFSLYHDYLG